MRALVLALLLLLAAPAMDAEAKRKRIRLKTFDTCSGLIAYGNRWAPRIAESAPPPRPAPAPQPVRDGAGGEAPAAAPQAEGAPTAGDDFSTTNVQEAGVDEPDIVKTDGTRVYAIARGALHAIDVSDATPKLRDRLKLGGGYGHQILIDGDRALVAWQGGPSVIASQSPSFAPVYYRPETKLALVDLSDPTRLRVLKTLTVEGNLVSSRLTGSNVRVVIATTPSAMEPQPVDSGGPAAQEGSAGPARTAARRRISRRRAAAWLPRGTFYNKRTKRRRTKALVACRATRHATAFSGLGQLTVLTIDLDKGLDPVDSDALMAGGETVYASKTRLFVASQRYVRSVVEGTSIPDGLTTEIHAFDVSEPGRTTYLGTGSILGFLLNQFSMSERKGVLRVASTSQPTWFAGEDTVSESRVTTLRVGDRALLRLGSVEGLGKGERIYAVRFFDDKAFVVTFRQIDPLYAIDLTNPESPQVRGELKIAGYSAYLHPAGDDLLIGVGQDATEEGRTTGTQISLFDVSDLANPTRLHNATIGGSSSAAEYDHHAFLWWPARDLAVLPVQIYEQQAEPRPGEPQPEEPSSSPAFKPPFIGAVGFSVKREGVGEAGRIFHETGDYDAAISRSLVVRGRLYTLSDAGIKASSLDDLSDIAYLAFD